MKNNIQKSLTALCFLLAVVGFYSSCSKMDDYKKLLQDSEISYTGKVDSLKIYSGRSRVLVTGLFISDPKVVLCKIYWDTRSDSALVSVVRKQGVDTLRKMITNLSEGVHSFELVTFDALGNKSVSVFGTGTVYADRYQASLINRPILGSELADNTNTTISWGTLDKTSGVFGSKILFTHVSDVADSVIVPIDTLTTVLKSFKYGSSFNYRTLYRPDTLCIDTFYTAYKSVDVKTNVTALYIKNAGSPFKYSVWDGSRWGALADWTTTTDVKNVSSGLYGGYELRNKVGVLSFEAGWGLPNVTNGKIYQTLALPAGSYTFEAVVDDRSSTGALYLAATAGSVLPDVTNVATTLANASLAIGTVQINFVLASPTTISLGFVGTLTGTGSTGMYAKVLSVKLKYLKP